MDILESHFKNCHGFALKADNGKYFTTNFEELSYTHQGGIEFKTNWLSTFGSMGLGGMNTKNEHTTHTTYLLSFRQRLMLCPNQLNLLENNLLGRIIVSGLAPGIIFSANVLIFAWLTWTMNSYLLEI